MSVRMVVPVRPLTLADSVHYRALLRFFAPYAPITILRRDG